jgi:hypothetical protein
VRDGEGLCVLEMSRGRRGEDGQPGFLYTQSQKVRHHTQSGELSNRFFKEVTCIKQYYRINFMISREPKRELTESSLTKNVKQLQFHSSHARHCEVRKIRPIANLCRITPNPHKLPNRRRWSIQHKNLEPPRWAHVRIRGRNNSAPISHTRRLWEYRPLPHRIPMCTNHSSRQGHFRISCRSGR